jgi:hypothetical protein
MAGPKRKPPKRLFKTTDRVSRFEADKSKRGKMKRMAREHEEVLEVIERACVTRWREHHDVDDQTVDLALHSAIVGETPDDAGVSDLAADLAIGRAGLGDTPDQVWIDALRVVRDSVRRHSTRKPGEIGYLKFIDEYIP